MFQSPLNLPGVLLSTTELVVTNQVFHFLSHESRIDGLIIGSNKARNCVSLFVLLELFVSV